MIVYIHFGNISDNQSINLALSCAQSPASSEIEEIEFSIVVIRSGSRDMKYGALYRPLLERLVVLLKVNVFP